MYTHHDRMRGVSVVLGALLLALRHHPAAAQDELPSDVWRAWKAEARATLSASSQHLVARLTEAETEQDQAFMAKLDLLSAALDSNTPEDLSKLKLLDKASLAILAVMLIDKLACMPRLAVESPLWIDARMTFGVWSGPECVFSLRLKIVCEVRDRVETCVALPRGRHAKGQVTDTQACSLNCVHPRQHTCYWALLGGLSPVHWGIVSGCIETVSFSLSPPLSRTLTVGCPTAPRGFLNARKGAGVVRRRASGWSRSSICQVLDPIAPLAHPSPGPHNPLAVCRTQWNTTQTSLRLFSPLHAAQATWFPAS